MVTISLNQIEFFAYHGVYKEEQKIGNKYSVDISVEISDDDEKEIQNKLSNTVNYEKLYKIVKDEMEKPAKLLENISRRIIYSVFDYFSIAQTVEVTVSKFNPPIGGVCSKAKVTVIRTRNQIKIA